MKSSHKKMPIAFFCFNRADKTEKSLANVVENLDGRPLYIFCDYARNRDELQAVADVSTVVDKYQDIATIIKRPINFGLKNNLIDGINYVFQFHDTICVVEDDILVGRNFFNFCEQQLNLQGNWVFSISGFNFPGLETEGIFYHHKFSSWGWATWKDRWQMINFDPYQTEIDYFLDKKRRKLKLIGDNFHEFLKFVRNGKIDSWATFAAFEALKRDLYTIYPCQPLVKNVGFSGGTHFQKHDPISEIYDKIDVDLKEKMPDNTYYPDSVDFFNSKIKGGSFSWIRGKNLKKIILLSVGFLLGFLTNNLI